MGVMRVTRHKRPIEGLLAVALVLGAGFLPLMASSPAVPQSLGCWGWNIDDFFQMATPAEVTTCVESGEDVSEVGDRGFQPLHRAAGYSSLEVVQILIDAGADVMARDDDGDTPLHWVAWQDNPRALPALLVAGAEVEAQNTNGATPLHYAARFGSPEVGRMLITAGAEVSAQDNDGITPLERAELGENEEVAALLRNPPTLDGRPSSNAEVPASDDARYVHASLRPVTDSANVAFGRRTRAVEIVDGSRTRAGIAITLSGVTYYLNVEGRDWAPHLMEYRFFPIIASKCMRFGRARELAMSTITT